VTAVLGDDGDVGTQRGETRHLRGPIPMTVPRDNSHSMQATARPSAHRPEGSEWVADEDDRPLVARRHRTKKSRLGLCARFGGLRASDKPTWYRRLGAEYRDGLDTALSTPTYSSVGPSCRSRTASADDPPLTPR
jgi:hypothetical protein